MGSCCTVTSASAAIGETNRRNEGSRAIGGDEPHANSNKRKPSGIIRRTSSKAFRERDADQEGDLVSVPAGTTTNSGAFSSGALPLTPTPPNLADRGKGEAALKGHSRGRLSEHQRPSSTDAGDHGNGIVSPVSHDATSPVARQDPHRPAIEGEEQVAVLRGGHETLFMDSVGGSEAHPTDLSTTVTSMTSTGHHPQPRSTNPLLSPQERGDVTEDEVDHIFSVPPVGPSPPRADATEDKSPVRRPRPVKTTSTPIVTVPATVTSSTQPYAPPTLPPLSPLAIRAPSGGHLPPLISVASSPALLPSAASPNTSVSAQMAAVPPALAPSPPQAPPTSKAGPSFILEEDDEGSPASLGLAANHRTDSTNRNWRPSSQQQHTTSASDQRALSIYSHRDSTSIRVDGPSHAPDDFHIATEVLQCAAEGDIVGLMDLVSMRGPEALHLRLHSLAPTAIVIQASKPALFVASKLDEEQTSPQLRPPGPSAPAAVFAPREESAKDLGDTASDGTAAYAPRAKKESTAKGIKLTSDALKQHGHPDGPHESDDEDLESIETGATEDSDDTTTAPPSHTNRKSSYLPLQRQSTAMGMVGRDKDLVTTPPIAAAVPPTTTASGSRPPSAPNKPPLAKSNLVQDAVDRMLGQKGRHTGGSNSGAASPISQSNGLGNSTSRPTSADCGQLNADGPMFLPHNFTPEGPYHVAARHNHTDVIDYLNRSKGRGSKGESGNGAIMTGGINEVLLGRAPLHEAILGGNHRCVYEMIHRHGSAVTYPGCVMIRQSQVASGEAAWRAFDQASASSTTYKEGHGYALSHLPASGSIGVNPLLAGNKGHARTNSGNLATSGANAAVSMADAVSIEVLDPFHILPSKAVDGEAGARPLHYHQFIIICEDCCRRKGFQDGDREQLGLLVNAAGRATQKEAYNNALASHSNPFHTPNCSTLAKLPQQGTFPHIPLGSRSNSRAPTPTLNAGGLASGGPRSRSPAFSNSNNASGPLNASMPHIGAGMNSSSYYGVTDGGEGSTTATSAALPTDYVIHRVDTDDGPPLAMLPALKASGQRVNRNLTTATGSGGSINEAYTQLFAVGGPATSSARTTPTIQWAQRPASGGVPMGDDPIVPAFCPMCCVEEQPLHLAASIGDFSMVLVLLETVVTAVCNVLGTKPTPLSSGHQGAVHASAAGAINRIVEDRGVSMDTPLNRWKAFVATRRRSSVAATKDKPNPGRPSSAMGGGGGGASSKFADVVKDLGLATPALAMLATFVNMRRFRDGYSPLHVAAGKGNLDIVEALVSHNGDTASRAVPTVSSIYISKGHRPPVSALSSPTSNSAASPHSVLSDPLAFYQQRSYTIPLAAMVPPSALSVGASSVAAASINIHPHSNGQNQGKGPARPHSPTTASTPYPYAAIGVRPLDVAKAARRGEVANSLTITAAKAKGGPAARLALGLVDEATLLMRGPIEDRDQVGALAANAITAKSSRKVAAAADMVGGAMGSNGGILMSSGDANQHILGPSASWLARLLGAAVRVPVAEANRQSFSAYSDSAKRHSADPSFMPPTSLAELFERNRSRMGETTPMAQQQRSSVASTATTATGGLTGTGTAPSPSPAPNGYGSANSTIQWTRNSSQSNDGPDGGMFALHKTNSKPAVREGGWALNSSATTNAALPQPLTKNPSSNVHSNTRQVASGTGAPLATRPPAVLPPLSSMSPTSAHLAPLRGGPAMVR